MYFFEILNCVPPHELYMEAYTYLIIRGLSSLEDWCYKLPNFPPYD